MLGEFQATKDVKCQTLRAHVLQMKEFFRCAPTYLTWAANSALGESTWYLKRRMMKTLWVATRVVAILFPTAIAFLSFFYNPISTNGCLRLCKNNRLSIIVSDAFTYSIFIYTIFIHDIENKSNDTRICLTIYQFLTNERSRLFIIRILHTPPDLSSSNWTLIKETGWFGLITLTSASHVYRWIPIIINWF